MELLGLEPSDLIYPLAAIATLLIKNVYLGIWHERKVKKERRELWIDTLCVDETIATCLEDFENLMRSHGKGSSLVKWIAVIAGFVIPILIIKPPSVSMDEVLTLLTINWYLLVPAILLMFFTNSLVLYDRNLIRNSKYVATGYHSLYQFAFASNVFIFWLGVLIIVEFPQEFIIDTELHISFLASYLFLIFSYLLSKSSLNYYGQHLAGQLNYKYVDDYPAITIKTKENRLHGVIQDIFDEDLVFLSTGTCHEVVEWENVSILRIHEKNWIDTTLSDF
ncbi:hypothetical protein LI82_12340 [Methanococcoides methylutens]|uniref:Uncharacterized protein n=1 Tax=Methanococcoides methylutens TaxID=2226 RepID=A0A099T2R8_METMT|nr:hypothetical protein [Methanococcoides methylutens]KGK98478.1 hypothetical protein LI82_12340 [Methanococcoides methylutens]